MKKNLSLIWVKFQREGIHRYPAALTDPNLADVAFLGYDHRHIFHFRVGIQVFTDDRDLEFIQFKRWLESLYGDGIIQLDHMSCEMISDDLAEVIEKKYPGRVVVIEVSEDGENGSTTHYSPEESAEWKAINDLLSEPDDDGPELRYDNDWND